MSIRFVTDYRHNDALRLSLNALAKKTFGIEFETWYQNGFWGDSVVPYSIADGSRIVSHITVSKLKFLFDGEQKTLIQLGTVMTDRAYRGQGISRMLMERVISEHQGKCGGLFLFANDTVLDFYPKFGFQPYGEFSYEKRLAAPAQGASCRKVSFDEKDNLSNFIHTVNRSASSERVSLADAGLTAFWVTGPFSDAVYYCPGRDAYAVAEQRGDTLFLHGIFAEDRITPEEAAVWFSDVRVVRTGFTPLAEDGFSVSSCRKPDSTLFGIGTVFDRMQAQKLIFPELSHT